MNSLRLSLVALCALLTLGCAPTVELPKGSSKGYSSVRLIAMIPGGSTEPQYAFGQGHIRKSIAAQFTSKGMKVTTGAADLAVGHLVVIQNNEMTTYLDEYYGSGVEAEAISDTAHRRGVIENKEREQFKRAGLVIDVLDTRTGELIFRNYVKRNLLPPGSSNTSRAQFINEAVAEALAPFFR